MMNLSKSRTQEIIKLHEGIASSMRRSVEDAIHIGELLSKAKEELDHGAFLPWIENELPFSQKTAWNYMALHSHQNKLVNITNLQDAYRRVEQLESEEAQKERERKDRLIAEKARTGVNPPGWDRSVTREEKKREEDIGYQERLASSVYEKAEQAKKSHESPHSGFEQIVDAILKEEPKHADLELDDMRGNVRQGKVFTVLREYIDSFEGVSRQLEATYNLMRYLKRVAIELQPKTQESA